MDRNIEKKEPAESKEIKRLSFDEQARILTITNRNFHVLRVSNHEKYGPQASMRPCFPYEFKVKFMEKKQALAIKAPFGECVMPVKNDTNGYAIRKYRNGISYQGGIEQIIKDMTSAKDICKDWTCGTIFTAIIERHCEDLGIAPPYEVDMSSEMKALMKRSDFVFGKEYPPETYPLRPAPAKVKSKKVERSSGR